MGKRSKPKSNIDSKVYVPGRFSRRRYQGTTVVTDFGDATEATHSWEIRKRVRDTSDPKSRREKPYHQLHIKKQGVKGVCVFTRNGARFDCFAGMVGSFGVADNPRRWGTSLSFPVHGNKPPRFSPTQGPWPLNPDLLSQAEIKCYASLRNRSAELDPDSQLTPGIWYGERHETAGMLRDALENTWSLVQGFRGRDPKQIADAIRRFTRGKHSAGSVSTWAKKEVAKYRDSRDASITRWGGKRRAAGPKEAAAALKFVTDATLTWNLGVAPLLSDLDKAYQACRYDLQSRRQDLLIKGKGWRQDHFVDTERFTTGQGNTVVTTRVNSLQRYSCLMIVSPSDSDLARVERLGLANPVSLAAELTSASFLVNYFWGILDWLKATSTPMAFVWKDGSWSLKVSHHLWFDVKSSSALGRHVAAGQWSHQEYRRQVYQSFPFPIVPLSFKEGMLNPRQAVNTSALLLSKVRKALGV